MERTGADSHVTDDCPTRNDTVDREPSDAEGATQRQCRWLRERIDALAAEADLEDDPQRARQWRRERRVLLRRADELGCFCRQPRPRP